jgi:putative ABC transport system ATP-binding protein
MIRLENVSKRYQMGKVTINALDHVSLNVDKGEFVVVLGPSGSGKTTLLNLISALDTPKAS